MTIATLSTSVQQCINNFTAALTRNKTLILQCIGFTFLWGLIAHGYMFANGNIFYDSLREFVLFEEIKLGVGRIFIPIYLTCIRGLITIPWLIGILALFYISLTAFLISKIFKLYQPLVVCILTGILTVNVTIISLTASFIHDLDVDMFALLLSVFAVYCWNKYKNGFWAGILPLTISLGLYQSYISTAITLVIIISIIDLLHGKTTREIIFNGIKAILMFIIAGVLYFMALKLANHIYEISLHSGRFNSLDTVFSMSPKSIGIAIIESYKRTVKLIFFFSTYTYKGGVVFIIYSIAVICALLALINTIRQKYIHYKSIVLICILLGVLPVGMNIARILTNNWSHDIMHYALWLSSLLLLVLIHDNYNPWSIQCWCKSLCIIALFIINCWNVRLANTSYMVREMEDKARLSLFTRVLSSIESYEGYIPGETKVAIVGQPKHVIKDLPEYQRTRMLMGMHKETMYTFNYYYFKYVLMTSINMVDTQNLQIFSMPSYPHKDAIKMIDDVLVVKIGEIEKEL